MVHGSDYDKFEITWERRRHAWEHLEAPATSLEAPRITVKQSGKNDIYGNIAGAPGNHSYYSLFNDF